MGWSSASGRSVVVVCGSIATLASPTGSDDCRTIVALRCGIGKAFRSSGGERSGLELAGGLVRPDHDARARDLAVSELQPGRDRALGEQPLARTEDDRKDHQVVRVDQVVAHQRLNEVATAVNLQLGPIFLLEGRDTI